MDLATRKMVMYGLLGLLVAGSTIALFQASPVQIIPKDGTLSLYFSSIPSDISGNQGSANSGQQPILQPSNAHPPRTPFNVTNLYVTIDSVMIHENGANDSGWMTISKASITIDLLKPSSVSLLIASYKVPAENVTMIELHVSNATATVKDPMGIVSVKIVVVSSWTLKISLDSGASVRGQMSTSVVANRPHIVIEGNGQIRLTPVLGVESISGPK